MLLVVVASLIRRISFEEGAIGSLILGEMRPSSSFTQKFSDRLLGWPNRTVAMGTSENVTTNFGESPKGEVRRIPIPRTSVNKAAHKLQTPSRSGGSALGWTSSFRG